MFDGKLSQLPTASGLVGKAQPTWLPFPSGPILQSRLTDRHVSRSQLLAGDAVLLAIQPAIVPQRSPVQGRCSV